MYLNHLHFLYDYEKYSIAMISTGKIATLAAVMVYVLMVIGAFVRANGFGLACPDWPTCHGKIIPDFTTPVIAEYTHRLVAALATLLVVVTTVVALKRHRKTQVALFASLTFVLIIAQVLLGMLTVLSELNPLLGTAHLALAVAVFASSIITAILALKISPTR